MSFRNFLKESLDGYYDMGDMDFSLEDFAKEIGEKNDAMISWEGNVAVVPNKIIRAFEKACKKLNIRFEKL